MTRRDQPRPPALASWLVRRVLPTDARSVVIGDLEERFAARVERVGPSAARRWYWRQAVGFLVRVPVQEVARRLDGVRRRPAAGLVADVRLAARTLRKRPGLAATAILILAIAVGANTTMFSVVDGILRQPLPYAEPDRLVMLWDVYPPEARMGDVAPVTLEHYHLWEAQTDLFAAVGAYESTSMAIERGGWPERLDGA